MASLKFFLATFVAITWLSKCQSEDIIQKKVIIIGAGVSGLSAALRLNKAGVKDVIIFEAMGRLGGRINTIPFRKWTIWFQSFVKLRYHYVYLYFREQFS